MSTYLYLRCMDHDPPLWAAAESGQHLCDLDQIRADIAQRERLVNRLDQDYSTVYGWYETLDHFRANTVSFLSQHRKCRIGIIDEYGDVHDVGGDA